MKSYKQIRDIIYNNPRADKQSVDSDKDEEDKIKNKMLYDDDIKRMKDAYQKRKRKQKKKKSIQYIESLFMEATNWKSIIIWMFGCVPCA